MKLISALISVLATILLAISYIALGYMVCADTEFVPRAVASMAISHDSALFTRDQLIEGAMAVRDYSFGDHDIASLSNTINQMNSEATTGFMPGNGEASASMDRYALPTDAIEHLDDVWEVNNTAHGVIAFIGIACVVLLVTSVILRSIRALLNALIGAGIIDLGILVLIAMMAFGSFDEFFNQFHGFFFNEGTWVFDADSLLITMLPEPFWMGVGTIWFLTTAIIAIISIVVGILLKRKLPGRK